MVSTAVAAEEESTEHVAAEPSLYSPAYLPRPAVAVDVQNPYEGAVASTSTNVVRSLGNAGPHVAAFHKTVETPFSTAHKSDVRFTNDVVAAGPYAYGPYAAPVPIPATAYGPYGAPVPVPATAYGPYAAPFPAAPYGPYPAPVPATAYGPHAAPVPTATAYGPYAAPYSPYAAPLPATAAYPYAAAGGPVKPYGYGPVVAHTSYAGPYGAQYSYKR